MSTNAAVSSLKGDIPPPPPHDKQEELGQLKAHKTQANHALNSLKANVPPPPEENGSESPNVNLSENEDSKHRQEELLKKTLKDAPKSEANHALSSLKGEVPPPPSNSQTNNSTGHIQVNQEEETILGSILEAKNIHILSEPWVKISKAIAYFQTLPANIKIKEENGIYSISDIKGLDSIDACALKILDRYKLQVESYKKQDFTKDLADFFHQIESNREYHARQLVYLYTNNPPNINKKDLEETTVEGLKQIDLYLHGMNTYVKDVYSKIWIVNATMIELGKWEVKEQILKPDYVREVESGDVSNLPSHIRMVSRIIRETKGTLGNLYPETVLMNYSYFYPVTLYHTGKDPKEDINLV
jgi:hypothetical protein